MLKTVKASTLRNHLADVMGEVKGKKDFVLVTRRSKPLAALVNLDFLEDLLALTSRDYLKSVRQARADFKAGRISSHEDVFGRLG